MISIKFRRKDSVNVLYDKLFACCKGKSVNAQRRERIRQNIDDWCRKNLNNRSFESIVKADYEELVRIKNEYDKIESNSVNLPKFPASYKKCSLKESMRRDSRYKYLRCIFQGEAIGEPDKLLEGANFKKFLKLVSDHMDYVILDTAPIGIVRDAELIASSVDAALLVIRQDWARSVEVNDVVDVLDDTGVSVLGGVLNMAVGDKSGVSSRNKRYGSYYYGYAEKNDA